MSKNSMLLYKSSYFICLLKDGFIAIELPTEHEEFALLMATFINQYGSGTTNRHRAEIASI